MAPASKPAARRDPAPLFVDAFSLAEWLLGRVGVDDRALPRSIAAHALAILSAIVLALRGRRRDEQLDDADEHLLVLRTELRLAVALGVLTEEQLVHAMQLVDRVGRQLGGWQRQLYGAS
jgi:hypothetical protein